MRMSERAAPSRPTPDLRFGAFAQLYEARRPAYPSDAVDWLLAGVDGLVVELGAGTGKFTAALAARGHQVLATEPDRSMLEVLTSRLPDVLAVQAAAEAIPVAAARAVVAAQAWHWFDASRAWAAATEVVGRSGRIGVVWNAPSQRSSWQREVAALGPTISPVTEGWWPAGLPKEGMERALFYWNEPLTAQEVRGEYSTHLAVQKLPATARVRYLDTVEEMAAEHAVPMHDRPGALVLVERLTWCARSAPTVIDRT